MPNYTYNLSSQVPKYLTDAQLNDIVNGIAAKMDDAFLTAWARASSVFFSDHYNEVVVRNGETLLLTLVIGLGVGGAVQEVSRIIKEERSNSIEYNLRSYLNFLQNLRRTGKLTGRHKVRADTILGNDEFDAMTIPFETPDYADDSSTLKHKLKALLANLLKDLGNSPEDIVSELDRLKKTIKKIDIKKNEFTPEDAYIPLDTLAGKIWSWIQRFKKTSFYEKLYKTSKEFTITYQTVFWLFWMSNAIVVGAEALAYAGILGFSNAITFGIPIIPGYMIITIHVRNKFREWAESHKLADLGVDVDNHWFFQLLFKRQFKYSFLNKWGIQALLDFIRVPILLPLALVPMAFEWFLVEYVSKDTALKIRKFLGYKIKDGREPNTPEIPGQTITRTNSLSAGTDPSRLTENSSFTSEASLTCETSNGENDFIIEGKEVPLNEAGDAAFYKALAIRDAYKPLRDTLKHFNDSKHVLDTKVWDPQQPAELTLWQRTKKFLSHEDRSKRLKNRGYARLLLETFTKIISGFVITYFTQVPVLAFLGLVCGISAALLDPGTIAIWSITLVISVVCWGGYYYLFNKDAYARNKAGIDSDRDDVFTYLEENGPKYHQKKELYLAKRALLLAAARVQGCEEQQVEKLLPSLEDLPEFDETAFYFNINDAGGDNSGKSIFFKLINRFMAFIGPAGSFLFVMRAMLLVTAGAVLVGLWPAVPIVLAGIIAISLSCAYGLFAAMLKYHLKQRDERGIKYCEEAPLRKYCLENSLEFLTLASNTIEYLLPHKDHLAQFLSVTETSTPRVDDEQMNENSGLLASTPRQETGASFGSGNRILVAAISSASEQEEKESLMSLRSVTTSHLTSPSGRGRSEAAGEGDQDVPSTDKQSSTLTHSVIITRLAEAQNETPSEITEAPTPSPSTEFNNPSQNSSADSLGFDVPSHKSDKNNQLNPVTTVFAIFNFLAKTASIPPSNGGKSMDIGTRIQGTMITTEENSESLLERAAAPAA